MLASAVIAMMASRATAAVHGVVPGSRSAASTTNVPSATTTSTLSPSAGNAVEEQQRQAEEYKSKVMQQFVREVLVNSSMENPGRHASAKRPATSPNPGPSTGTMRLAILLALIVLAGILLPVAFASTVPGLQRTIEAPGPQATSRGPHPSALFSTYLTSLVLLCLLLLFLPSRAAAQVPNIVIPPNFKTSEAGGQVYTLTVCNPQETAPALNRTGTVGEEKRWVPLK